MKHSILFFLCLTLLFSCKSKKESEERESEGKDQLGLIVKNEITADLQTEAVPQTPEDDAADDPAIWVNPEHPDSSVIYGTDKKGGLIAYDLQGKTLAYYKIGRTNNVDIRQNVVMGGDTIDILACTNRTHHNISVARIGEKGELFFYKNTKLDSKTKGDVYGFSLYHSRIDGSLYAYLNSKRGEIEQWKLIGNKDEMTGKMVRKFSMKDQTEGMVADDKRGIMYLGVEEKGIYKFEAEPSESFFGSYILRSKPNRNKFIEADIEGLAIYRNSDCDCYLIASSQGNYTYAVFELSGDNRYLFSFRIEDNKKNAVDGVEETDGLEVISNYISEDFPIGMLIVQDGYNRNEKGELQAQNFKYINWEKIQDMIK